jgi:hypothetical protein
MASAEEHKQAMPASSAPHAEAPHHNLRTSGAGQSSSDDMPGQPKLMETADAPKLSREQLESMEVERHAKYAHGAH